MQSYMCAHTVDPHVEASNQNVRSLGKMFSCCFGSSSEEASYWLEDIVFNQEVVLPDEEGDMSDFFESTEEEGERILSSSKWIPVIPNCNRSSHDFEAAWRKVEGTRLVFARSLSRFPNVDADALFAFIGSPHGFEMIDPATKNHGTCCVRNYSPPDRMLHTNTKITLDHSKTHFFGLAPRQFQTVNIRNGVKKLFCSKSCTSSLITMDDTRITCYTTYILRCRPLEGGGTLLEQASWVNLGGCLPPFLINEVNRGSFFQGINTRLQRYFKENDHLELGLAQAPGTFSSSKASADPAEGQNQMQR